AAFLANETRPRAVKLHFARGIGTIAELRLEPLQVKCVRLPIRRPAWQKKTREPAGSLREHQKGVTHRSRAEPLVPVDNIFAAADGLGSRSIGAHIGTALLLGHRHADEHA